MKILSAEFVTAAHAPGRYPPPALPEIVFAGRSNVGKSSLLNALLGRKGLARTSGTPGRTQAIQFYRVNGKFLFVDLPGYGYAQVPEAIRRTWRPLVEGYFSDRPVVRATVVILDIRRDPGEDDLRLLQYLAHARIPAILVLTKADKIARGRIQARVAAIARAGLGELTLPEGDLIVFSSTMGLGKSALWRRIREAIEG
ncbi:MAG: YihA family ribosome biogenesis GTP-binding protein [Deltaproteobacteria bacterium RBG_13_65_10]|nr:MAG: YihA family ribosome biogenesis GTP-binding protein [Deltaproteobacteria bacterium RBG_13_65_10]